MKNYRNDEFNFEMNVPEKWSLTTFRSHQTSFGESIDFGCDYYESFTLKIRPLNSQPLLEQIENEFRRYVRDYNYTSLELGRIIVESKEHIWVRYYQGGGKWIKKYLVVVSGIEYAFTATCFYTSRLSERESVWDEVVKSFHIKANSVADYANRPPAPAEIGLQGYDQGHHLTKDRKMKELSYKKGDIIGQKYEVYGVLGQGGFGVVYLVYLSEMSGVYALKTFRDEFLANQEVRKRFLKEASLWLELERHPYLVRAYFVDEVSGRLYIGMEYIAPNEQGLNTLEGYLQRRPPDLAQSLRWAIQICHAMEYATSKGVRAHRDLKPANIMISQDKTAKVTDFGMAGVFSDAVAIPTASWGVQPGRIGLSGQTMLGQGFGTPTHMSPEQFNNAAGCDERSDIYSFGIMLYQMAAGGQLPFLAHLPRNGSAQEMEVFWRAMQRIHCEAPAPHLDSPLSPIIQRCLEKSPEKRYQAFQEVRKDLELLLQHQTKEGIKQPQLKELEAWEWSNKGGSLNNLGRYGEAVRCFDKALELNPHFAIAWNGKGGSLDGLGRYEEAMLCYDKALELDPHDPQIWSNKGGNLGSLGRYEEAIHCCDNAIELDPCYASAWYNKGHIFHNMQRYEDAIRFYDKALELDPRNVAALMNKGTCLDSFGRYAESVCCYDKALELDPRCIHVWYGKGNSLSRLGLHEEAIRDFDKALELDPSYVNAWTNKGICLRSLGRCEEAICCYDKALELEPRDPQIWNNKGNSLSSLGRYEQAIGCYNKALELDPHYANAWNNKGGSLNSLGRYAEAIRCYDKALELNPHNAGTWYNKAIAEDKLGHWREATRSYQQFLALAPAQVIQGKEHARQRLRELGGK